MRLDVVYNKSCLRMDEVADKSIPLIITDPPWNISKQVKIHRATNPERYRYKTYKYQGKDLDFGPWDHFKLKAAKRQGRHYIGYEIDPDYCKLIEPALAEIDPLFTKI